MEQYFRLGAASAATKAKRILSGEKILGRIVKTEDSPEGCTWGIAVKGESAQEAAQILKRAGIRYEAL